MHLNHLTNNNNNRCIDVSIDTRVSIYPQHHRHYLSNVFKSSNKQQHIHIDVSTDTCSFCIKYSFPTLSNVFGLSNKQNLYIYIYIYIYI